MYLLCWSAMLTFSVQRLLKQYNLLTVTFKQCSQA